MSKRATVFLAVLCLILVGAGTNSRAENALDLSVYSSALDAAFAAGNLTLKEMPPDGLQFSADDIVIPEAYLAGVDQSAMDAALSSLRLVSVAPNGKAALLTEGSLLFAWYGGKLRPILLNTQRGVEDPAGNLEKLWQQSYRTFFGSNIARVAWSPDGRYAVLSDVRAVLIMNRFTYNPHLIDLETGDIFPVAVYGKNLIKEKVGAVTTACFSRDGRYVYYMVYGTVGGNRSTLMRYDLREAKFEACCSAANLDYYPRLSELRDGSLMIIQDYNPALKNSQANQSRSGIARYINTGVGWMRFSHNVPVEASKAYVKELQYSDESGYAVNIAWTDQYPMTFQVCQPDRNFEGLDDYWAFDIQSGKPVKLTHDQVRNSTEQDARRPGLYKYEIISSVTLSPNGRYALFRTNRPATAERTVYLRLVRLSDMQMVEVKGIETAEMLGMQEQRCYAEWNSGVLLISLKSGMRAYVFE